MADQSKLLDASDVGMDKRYKTMAEKLDAHFGQLKEHRADDLSESRSAVGNMPKQPDPSPFKLGPMSPNRR